MLFKLLKAKIWGFKSVKNVKKTIIKLKKAKSTILKAKKAIDRKKSQKKLLVSKLLAITK